MSEPRNAPLSDAAVQGLMDSKAFKFLLPFQEQEQFRHCLAELLEGRARLARGRAALAALVEFLKTEDGDFERARRGAYEKVLSLLDAPVELCVADVCSADGEHFPAPVDRTGDGRNG